MKQFWKGGWLIALVCVLIGFMIAVQFRTAQDGKGSLSQQRIEEISDRLLQTEHLPMQGISRIRKCCATVPHLCHLRARA